MTSSQSTSNGATPVSGAARVLTAWGSRDTHKHSGKDYQGISWAEVVARASEPTATAKENAQFIIPSTYRGPDGRSHDVQRGKGSFPLLCLDVDSGNPSQDALRLALVAVCGDVEALIYSSSGASADKRKWRALIPLRTALAGADYQATQNAFFALLADHGITADAALNRAGQPVYLPNVPADKRAADGNPIFYAFEHIQGPRLDFEGSAIASKRAAMVAEIEREEKEQAEARAAFQIQRAKHIAAGGDDFEPIAHFNATHSIADLLTRYGFEKERGGDNWRSPYQTSKTFAFKNFSDHWVSLSGSDADAGLGKETPNGNRTGDPFDLFAHFEHDGDKSAAVREYANEVKPRDGKGRFTGQGVVKPDDTFPTFPPPVFMEPSKARAQIKLTLEGFLEETAQFIEAGEQEALPPVLAIAASAGSGKSTMTRKALAAFDLALFGGDVVFYTPTLALADEAATEFGGHVTRGRSATNPDTGEPMCNRSELAQKVGNAGLNVKATLCEKRLADGTTSLCPHFHSCAYLNQWDVLPDKPVVRFETHNYLTIGGDGSGRKPALRVIDESIWRQFTRVVDLQIDQWVRPRNPYVKGESKAAVDHATELAADASQASLDVLRALQNGSGPLSLPYSAEDYSGFAEAEVQPMTLRGDPTDSDDNLFAELARKEMDAAAMKRRRLWLILADCKERELTQTERLRLIVDTPLQGGGKADVIRITWLADLPHDVPVLLLDADATPKITKRIYPNARLESFTLKPNAEVIQLTDKTLSKATVLDRPAVNNSGNRREMAELVRAEVYRDSLTGNRGVLAIATKEIVEAIFKDAGHDIDSMGGNAQRALMMDTPLHGARWLWFGPASLGLNTWEKFGTAIVFGREELPVGVLEDMGLALFGDTDEPVQMVQPNEKGQMLLPRVPLPLHMADGSAAALATTAHPDRRVREIQEQTRERSTGQSIERLRLANAVNRKRVVLASAVPIPNLPVDRLVTWQELRPTRFEAAIAEAAASGSFLRLSAAGLAADAPLTFPTEKAAARWLSREGREQVNTPTPLIRDTINGAGVLTPVFVNIRLEGQRGPRPTPALALTSRAGRDEAVAQFGALSLYEAQTQPAPEPIQSSEVLNAEDIPELRPQIRQMRVNNMISIAPYMRSLRSCLPQSGSIALVAEALHRTKDKNTISAFARISPSQVQADLDALFVLGLVDRDMNLEGVFAPRKLVMDCSIKGSDLMAAFMAQKRVEMRAYA